ncbi:hypothetical protein ACHFJ0_04920 [Paracoccus sp. NGMCC 1.201697]|uniref:Uncharacterized protein n=1 Tax=Paracoccus broussonetiae subsp. drimophilus TaxID=3373869 RepID=A0ABW7LJL6_9RHOB
MTLYDPDDSRHDAITPQERALIDGHIAQHGVTVCQPGAMRGAMTRRELHAEQSRVGIARRMAVRRRLMK